MSGIANRRWGRLVPLVLTLALAACGAAERRPSTAQGDPVTVVPAPPPMSSPPPTARVDTLALPLTAYTATNRQRALVDTAFAELLNRCMARHGFAPRFQPPSPPQPPTPLSWRYGIGDATRAARYGYHTPPEHRLADPRERDRMRSRDAANPMSDEERRAYTGGGTDGGRDTAAGAGGCLGETERRLGATDRLGVLDDGLAQVLGMSAYDQSRRDSRVVDAFARWRSCMAGAGYTVDDPMAAGRGFDLTTPAPDAAEIAMAVADATCTARANLAGTWFAVEAAYQDWLVAANRAGLEAGRRSVETAVRVAAETLGVPAPG
jgi:hypothetical protein